jgi:hypothetical protein
LAVRNYEEDVLKIWYDNKNNDSKVVKFYSRRRFEDGQKLICSLQQQGFIVRSQRISKREFNTYKLANPDVRLVD